MKTYDGTHGRVLAGETRNDWPQEDRLAFAEIIADDIFRESEQARRIGMNGVQFTYEEGGAWLHCPPAQRLARFPPGSAGHAHSQKRAQREAEWKASQQRDREADARKALQQRHSRRSI